ncbi:MAG: BsuBI/PstI family type II restriction endonuclease [Rhodocyclales bacterium]|nr:BsuBI/PstI family type II restriction endonuclease [Rhodocyclales bacterium]
MRHIHSEHHALMRSVMEGFGARFGSDGRLVYAEISDDEQTYLDRVLMAKLGACIDSNCKMPDVVLYVAERNLLLLIECISGRGCINAKRKTDLGKLFERSAARLVFVSAFPDREVMSEYLDEIAWETEAWVADAPSHIIHFNGDKFLGPH